MEENYNNEESANIPHGMFSFSKIFLKKYEATPMTCVVCNIKYRHRKNYDKHVQKYLLDPIQDCQHCEAKFHTRDAVLLHLKKEHEKQFTCYSCSNTFESEQSLKEHVDVHNPDVTCKHQCELCGRRFSTRQSKFTHLRLHLGLLSEICDICGKDLRTKDRLRAHIRVHKGEKPVSCDQCEKCFTTRYLLKMHMRSHSGEKPYSCTDCGKKFSQHSSLSMHMRRHTGYKPFTCTLCPKTFINTGDLKRHMSTHTASKTVEIPTEVESELQQSRDRRSHTENKAYSCGECGKAYVRLPALRKHEKTQHLK